MSSPLSNIFTFSANFLPTLIQFYRKTPVTTVATLICGRAGVNLALNTVDEILRSGVGMLLNNVPVLVFVHMHVYA